MLIVILRLKRYSAELPLRAGLKRHGQNTYPFYTVCITTLEGSAVL